MENERLCEKHERCSIDEKGTHWRVILAYGRDERGWMTNFWSNDLQAASRVIAAEVEIRGLDHGQDRG